LSKQIFNEYFSISIILDQNETLLLRKNYELFARLTCEHAIVCTILDLLGETFFPCLFESCLLQQPGTGSAAQSTRFGKASDGLGLLRTIKSHVILQALLAPVYYYLLRNEGPHLYPEPWFGKCEKNCTKETAPLPENAPHVEEFVVHFLFALFAMDAAYGYWHFCEGRFPG